LLSVQGPKADALISSLGLALPLPAEAMSFSNLKDWALGEIYCTNHARTAEPERPLSPAAGGEGARRADEGKGFDVFVPTSALGTVAAKLTAAAKAIGGRPCGWQALETARIEAGIPRFGADMDEANLPPETGIESRALSYTKGCYTGQEVIARIRTYGQVAKALRGLRLADDSRELPKKGDKLFHDGKEVGYITSAVASPTFKANLALGYVRREHNQVGTELTVRTHEGESRARIVTLPFRI
jgi:folate-binding protein YgfZ